MSMTDSSVKEANLGLQASRGVAWMMGQSMLAKAVSFCGQIVLAWILAPEDFGAIALAYTATVIAGLVENLGLREVLVQRSGRFRRWSTAAFWMSLAAGAVAASILGLIAPLVALVYSSPVVAPLIWILAVATPINAASIVPHAQLSSQMRFKDLATIELGNTFLLTFSTIVLASMGLGAFSFAIARPIAALYRTTSLWYKARSSVTLHLRLRRWPMLLGDSSWLFLAMVFGMMMFQGDYVALGLVASDVIVGYYFFAYSLSRQSVYVVGLSTTSVLLPTFVQVADPNHQDAAYLRAVQLLAFVMFPIGALQVMLADPAVRLLFDPRWSPAVPLLQLLSVGAAFAALGGVGRSMMQARGRYRLRAAVSAGQFAVFVPVVGLGAVFAGAPGVAAGVTAVSILGTSCSLVFAANDRQRATGRVLQCYWPGLLVSTGTAAGAWLGMLLARSIDNSGALSESLFGFSMAVGLALITGRVAAPQLLSDLINRLSRMLKPEQAGRVAPRGDRTE